MYTGFFYFIVWTLSTLFVDHSYAPILYGKYYVGGETASKYSIGMTSLLQGNWKPLYLFVTGLDTMTQWQT
jgi:hypothetical protein